jgi:ubiquinone/menaquinone biosynthesis C-methylase UbiE
MSDVAGTVRAHYGDRGDMMSRIEAELRSTGVDPMAPRYQDYYPFDQLHGVGIAATADHAERAGLKPGMRVLDLGCGIGGCSRYLTAERQCRVTGLDLTPEFIAVARELTRRCGLGDAIRFHEGNALDLPFGDASFDHVWCHNVTMNIPDKKKLASEVARVLKPGGRFSCVEIAQGPAGAPSFPLPWAMDPSASFLATPQEMRAALESGGLRIIEQTDITPASIAYAKETAERAARGERSRLRNGIVIGGDFMPRARNSSLGLMQGTLLDQFILAERA